MRLNAHTLDQRIGHLSIGNLVLNLHLRLDILHLHRLIGSRRRLLGTSRVLACLALDDCDAESCVVERILRRCEGLVGNADGVVDATNSGPDRAPTSTINRERGKDD